MDLTSPRGEFDVAFVPSGTQGYEGLARHAHIVESHGESIPVADLDDVIKSKEAAGRPEDIVHLPILIQISQRRRVDKDRESGFDIGL